MNFQAILPKTALSAVLGFFGGSCALLVATTSTAVPVSHYSTLPDTWKAQSQDALQPTSIQSMIEIRDIFTPIEKKYFSNIALLNHFPQSLDSDQRKRLYEININSQEDLNLLWKTVICIQATTLILSHELGSPTEYLKLTQKLRENYFFLQKSDTLSAEGRRDIETKLGVLNQLVEHLQQHEQLNRDRIDEQGLSAVAVAVLGPIDCGKVARCVQCVFDLYKVN